MTIAYAVFLIEWREHWDIKLYWWELHTVVW